MGKFAENSHNLVRKIHSSDDPMTELGPGISTYHQLLVMLFALFFILALIHIPVIQNFTSYDFYGSQGGFIVGASLGNMGYS